MIYKTFLDTPIGQMIAIADDNALLFLDFSNNPNFEFPPLESTKIYDEINPLSAKRIAEGAILEGKEDTDLIKIVDSERIKPQVQVNKSPKIETTPKNDILISTQMELEEYFKGTLKEFKTKISVSGSPFQIIVWEELQKIPFGKTISYQDLAKKIAKPKACRAVAKANASNNFAIIIPCHRVINKNGKIGGYAGGVYRKKWLLQHEDQKFLA